MPKATQLLTGRVGTLLLLSLSVLQHCASGPVPVHSRDAVRGNHCQASARGAAPARQGS